MAKGKPNPQNIDEKQETFWKKITDKWNDELCAEHDDTIASFKNLSTQIDDIENYEIVFKREQLNLSKVGKVAGFTIGGVVVFAPLSILAAPTIASTLGGLGVLGTASTGTIISTLGGAALTSASLAAVGGGTVIAGVTFITAAGAALGAIQGGRISNYYFGELKNTFSILKQNEGSGPAIIYINGFLTEKDEDTRDWRSGIRGGCKDYPWYHLKWDSKNLSELGKMIAVDGEAARQFAKKLAKKMAKKAGSKLNPLTLGFLLSDLISNPWHTAMVRAAMTGILLADLMARTKNQEFILMGHSLGARVIYYALATLATKETPIVRDAILLGGAVGSRDTKGWENAARAVKGCIYNCFSKKDLVLKYIYQGANFKISQPIGYQPIVSSSNKIVDVNCTSLVNAHTNWKGQLQNILEKIDKSY